MTWWAGGRDEDVRLPLKEQVRIRLTVETRRNWVEETAGLMSF